MSISGSRLETVVLTSSALELTVLPGLGARLHRLRAFGVDVFRTPDDPLEHERDPFYWGAYVMAPWCNRLAAQPVAVAGREVRLPSNFADGTAIHGQVYVSPWTQVGDAEFEIRGGDDGWPWAYRVGLALALDDATLSFTLSLGNLADGPMPAGVGLHPWFRLPLELAVRADGVFTSNLDSSAQPEPVSGAHDLRRLAPMKRDLDGTWTELAEPPAELRWPTLGVAGQLTSSSSGDNLFITAASPSNVDAIAVEPQTHAPQGLRRLLAAQPGALDMVAPGESLRLSSQLIFHQTTGDAQI